MHEVANLNRGHRLEQALRAYGSGARTLASGRLIRYPAVVARLLAARIGFGFGPLLYSLYGLDRKPMSTWRTYLRDTGRKEMYAEVNPLARRRPLNDKLMFRAECVRHGLPSAPILALFPGTDLTDAWGVPAVADRAHFVRLLAGQPQGLFLKPVGGSHGEGAFRILPAKNGGCLLPTGPASIDDAYSYCVERARAHTLLVQPRLVNHPALRGIMSPVGFGTVRVMTWLDEGEPRLLGAVLRIIAGDNVADNFLRGTAGNLAAAVDPATGRLACVRASRLTTWPVIEDVAHHPAVGLQLPCWPEVVDLVFRGQRAFTGLRIIGWDVGITGDGPLLVEGNATPDCDLMQLAYDRGFRPEFERIIGRPLAGEPTPLW